MVPTDRTNAVAEFSVTENFMTYYKKVAASDHPEAEQLLTDLQKALVRVTRIKKAEAQLAKVATKAKK